MRQLTTYFSSFRIAQYEKKSGKSIIEIFDVGNLEVNKICEIIWLGNAQMKEIEEAYQRFDDWLRADEDNSIVSALFVLMEEFDKDVKLFRACGVDISQMIEKFRSEMVNRTRRLEERLQSINNKDAVDTPELTVVK